MVMYYVSKKMEIAGCHRLTLSYKSKCENLHGHNWIVTVFCKAKEVNADGMVVDKNYPKNYGVWIDSTSKKRFIPGLTMAISMNYYHSIQLQKISLNGLQNRFQSVTKQKCRKAKVILLFM